MDMLTSIEQFMLITNMHTLKRLKASVLALQVFVQSEHFPMCTKLLKIIIKH